MQTPGLVFASVLAPTVLMVGITVLAQRSWAPDRLWRAFVAMASTALGCALVSLAWQLDARRDLGHMSGTSPLPGLAMDLPGAWLAVVVAFLGLVIGAFSSRYLQGEARQSSYVGAFAGVLGAVQVLLLADHWLVLIPAWAITASLLNRLLCFYRERPFALLAAHKKRLADRLADGLLLAAAATAWWEVGSGSLSALRAHLAQTPAAAPLQWCAVCLALAVILRTALLPVHGWLTQVMEAPTPVSALLHAGVVNLGGFVLVRFAPLLASVAAARWLLVLVGMATALLAGQVMLTRVSIKVRLAWSTVAQMGFMVLECGLGLYSLAMLHLLGHSLYKAHAFLSSSTVVRQSRQRMLRGRTSPSTTSMLAAPLLAGAIVWLGLRTAVAAPWPLWWAGILALAWAPLLWIPARPAGTGHPPLAQWLAGPATVAALTAAAMLAHRLPVGGADSPRDPGGRAALAGFASLYLAVSLSQCRPRLLREWRRWSYAGFFLDEFYTRAALRFWPTRWTSAAAPDAVHRSHSH